MQEADRDKERELWNPMNKAFFEGPKDPDLVHLSSCPTAAPKL